MSIQGANLNKSVSLKAIELKLPFLVFFLQKYTKKADTKESTGHK